MNDERFEKINKLKQRGFKGPTKSEEIPETYSPDHGYYVVCYQRFTASKKTDTKPEETKPPVKERVSRRKKEEKDGVTFVQNCIFCGLTKSNRIKCRRSWIREHLVPFKNDSWKDVVKQADAKSDENLMTRIRGYDLFACGALFHLSCQKVYMRNPMWEIGEERIMQANLEKAHADAFGKVCEVIRENIIEKNQVMKLTDLRNIYVSQLEVTEFPNQDYRNEKLKKKIEQDKMFSSSLGFVRLEECSKFQPYLVYNTKTYLSSAVKFAYSLGTQDNMSSIASTLSKEVFMAANT